MLPGDEQRDLLLVDTPFHTVGNAASDACVALEGAKSDVIVHPDMPVSSGDPGQEFQQLHEGRSIGIVPEQCAT